jgi:hypothetical protein
VLLRLAYLGVTNAFALLRLLPRGDGDKDAARHRLGTSLSATADDKKQGKEDIHSLPLSPYNTPGVLRQDPGHGAESSVEART